VWLVCGLLLYYLPYPLPYLLTYFPNYRGTAPLPLLGKVASVRPMYGQTRRNKVKVDLYLRLSAQRRPASSHSKASSMPGEQGPGYTVRYDTTVRRCPASPRPACRRSSVDPAWQGCESFSDRKRGNEVKTSHSSLGVTCDPLVTVRVCLSESRSSNVYFFWLCGLCPEFADKLKQ
jgi:hypothetical protein